MISRRAYAWVWWLLPFLVARALVPVGFMAQPVDGTFRLVFCSAGYSQPQADLDSETATHAGQQTGDHAQNDFSCPFGSTTAAPLLDASNAHPVAFIPDAEVLPLVEPPYLAAGPPRFIATRGPPSLI